MNGRMMMVSFSFVNESFLLLWLLWLCSFSADGVNMVMLLLLLLLMSMLMMVMVMMMVWVCACACNRAFGQKLDNDFPVKCISSRIVW